MNSGPPLKYSKHWGLKNKIGPSTAKPKKNSRTYKKNVILSCEWILDPIEIYKRQHCTGVLKKLDPPLPNLRKRAGPIKDKYVILSCERIMDPIWNI